MIKTTFTTNKTQLIDNEVNEAKNNVYFIDVKTLFEKNYTGIPMVNLHIAKFFIKRYLDKTKFFYGKYVLNTNDIIQAIENQSGSHLLKRIEEMNGFFISSVEEEVRKVHAIEKKTIGIYSFTRTNEEKYFDYEYQVAYDLTPIVTPQFHTDSFVKDLSPKMQFDAEVCDEVISISEATKIDLVKYLGINPEKINVSLLGSVYHPYYTAEVKTENKDILNLKNKKFVYVLGTIEPRKNILRIFDYLDKYSDDNDYTFVFTGKAGWGKSFEDSAKDYISDPKIVDERIKYLGYVSEEDKIYLLKNAFFTIYPSVYEGFGLPVLESMSVGTPTITTISTSMPEICQELGYYFDPFNTGQLREIIKKVSSDIEKDENIRRKFYQKSLEFTWDNFCKNAFSL